MWSCFFFFKQKTAYEMRISDWSSDVCSSDLRASRRHLQRSARRSAARNDHGHKLRGDLPTRAPGQDGRRGEVRLLLVVQCLRGCCGRLDRRNVPAQSGDALRPLQARSRRSEEHTSALQSLMRISYAVFCLKKKNIQPTLTHSH